MKLRDVYWESWDFAEAFCTRRVADYIVSDVEDQVVFSFDDNCLNTISVSEAQILDQQRRFETEFGNKSLLFWSWRYCFQKFERSPGMWAPEQFEVSVFNCRPRFCSFLNFEFELENFYYLVWLMLKNWISRRCVRLNLVNIHFEFDLGDCVSKIWR